MRDIHSWFGWVVVGTNAAVGVWFLAAHRFTMLRARVMWWALVVAELAVFAQVGLGTFLVGVEKFKATNFHMLYGFSGLFSIGILYSYRQQMEKQKYLLYGFGSLFIMGLALRAITIHARA